MSSNYFRKKIILLNFVATMLIVALHALPPVRFGMEVSWDMPLFYILMVVCQMGVPMFFFISGLLFFNTCDSIGNVSEKLQRRVKTLLVPYLLWNTIFVAIFYILTNVDFTSNLMNMGKPFTSPERIFIAIVDSRFTPLWFVKMLMFYTILTPIIYLVLQHKLLFCAITIAAIMNALPMQWTDYDSFWMWLPIYLLGCGMGYYKFSFRRTAPLIVVVAVGLVVALTMSCFNLDSMMALRLISPITIWILIDCLLSNIIREKFVVKRWMTYTFFIYCTHYFILNVLQKIAVKLFEPTALVMWLTFVITVVMTVGSLILVANIFHDTKAYKILTGGR